MLIRTFELRANSKPLTDFGSSFVCMRWLHCMRLNDLAHCCVFHLLNISNISTAHAGSHHHMQNASISVAHFVGRLDEISVSKLARLL